MTAKGNAGSVREVRRLRNADMAAYDALPDDIRQAMQHMALPYSALDLSALLVRTPAPVVVTLLNRAQRDIDNAYRRRVGLC